MTGYFGELAGVNFQKDAEGRDLFYPFGMLGKGRILPDPETATRLRANAALVLELTMFASLACFAWTFIAINGFQHPFVYIAYPWVALFVGSAIVSIGMWFYYFKITRLMVASGQRLTPLPGDTSAKSRAYKLPPVAHGQGCSWVPLRIQG